MDLETLFNLMGTELKPRGTGSFMASCPFGHNHSSGTDKHPSMSVIYGDPSGYKCFGCNDSGTVRKLAKKWLAEKGDSRPLEFIRGFDDKKAFGERAMERGSYQVERAKRMTRMAKRAKDTKKPITEKELKDFLHEVPEYAFERGLTKKQIIDWEIGYDPYQDRMIIPVRDMHGKLFGVSGRDLSGQSKIKYRHYPGLNKEAVLYGEKFINIKKRRAYIVEGFFDVHGLQRHGLENVFATMGTSISTYQEQKLLRWFDEIIFVPDGDLAGLKFAIEYGHKLLLKIPKIGIAGVEKNKDYVIREKPAKWEPQDYKYNLLPPLIGTDPGELRLGNLNVTLKQMQILSLWD